MKIRPLILSLGILAALSLQSLRAEQNLLKNGNFESGDGQSVTKWLFLPSHLPKDPEEAAKVVHESFKEEDGNRCLKVSTTASVPNLHVFWTQEKEDAIPGGAYHLKFRAKGTFAKEGGNDRGNPDAGVYFKDADGQWIGHIPVPNVEFTDGWADYELNFTAPENAASVGVRFGLHCQGGIASLLVDDAVLTEGAQ